MADQCSWCGIDVAADDGFRVGEPEREHRAVFCRLEHVVPWFIQGPHWQPGETEGPSDLGESLETCAQCGSALADVRVVLVRHRGDHRIGDAFCAADHLADWAKSGGRWRQP